MKFWFIHTRRIALSYLELFTEQTQRALPLGETLASRGGSGDSICEERLLRMATFREVADAVWNMARSRERSESERIAGMRKLIVENLSRVVTITWLSSVMLSFKEVFRHEPEVARQVSEALVAITDKATEVGIWEVKQDGNVALERVWLVLGLTRTNPSAKTAAALFSITDKCQHTMYTERLASVLRSWGAIRELPVPGRLIRSFVDQLLRKREFWASFNTEWEDMLIAVLLLQREGRTDDEGRAALQRLADRLADWYQS